MEKIRAFTGELKVLETANPKLYAVEIMALNSEVNRNNWQYINLQQHLNEFLDIPILTAYVGGGMIIGDGHNYNMKVTLRPARNTPRSQRPMQNASWDGYPKTSRMFDWRLLTEPNGLSSRAIFGHSTQRNL